MSRLRSNVVCGIGVIGLLTAAIIGCRASAFEPVHDNLKDNWFWFGDKAKGDVVKENQYLRQELGARVQELKTLQEQQAGNIINLDGGQAIAALVVLLGAVAWFLQTYQVSKARKQLLQTVALQVESKRKPKGSRKPDDPVEAVVSGCKAMMTAREKRRFDKDTKLRKAIPSV